MKMARPYSVFTYAVLLFGVSIFLAAIATWFRLKVEIPVRDTLVMLPLVASGVIEGWGSIPLQDWIAPISGGAHRVAVSRFLMLLDYTFLGGHNYALYLSAWLSILALVFVYVRTASLQSSQDRAGRCFVAGLALIFLCSPTQLLNLVNPISNSWYVAFACSAASLLIIISAGSTLGFWKMVLACSLAAIAAYSNFTGVVTCLLLPVIALHQRSRLAMLVLVFSAALVFSYFSGFGSNYSASVQPEAPEVNAEAGMSALGRLAVNLETPAHWPVLSKKIARFVSLHLGAPLSEEYPLFASLVVLSSLLLVGYLWVILLLKWSLRKKPGSRSIEFCLAMASICIGISAAIVLGRQVHLSPFALRFQTVAMVYWLSIGCLIFFKAQGLCDKRILKQVLILLACVPAIPIIRAYGPVTLLVADNSNYESATQILGQLGRNFYERQTGWGAEWYAALIADHQEFLEDYGFRPLHAQAIDSRNLETRQDVCDGFRLQEMDSDWPGMQEVRIRPKGITTNPFLTRMDIRGDNGALGRLYAHVPEKSDLRSVFFDGRVWRGFYLGKVSESLPVTLYIDPAIGRSFKCFLTEQEP